MKLKPFWEKRFRWRGEGTACTDKLVWVFLRPIGILREKDKTSGKLDLV